MKTKTAIILTLAFYALMGLILPGCGRYIDPKLQPYVDRFQQVARSQGKIVSTLNVEVRFGTTTASEQGECRIVLFQTPTVIISDLIPWDDFDDLAKELLMYHELGHCILFRQHTHEFRSDGTQDSIMNGVVLVYPQAYKQFHNYYLLELFSTVPLPPPILSPH